MVNLVMVHGIELLGTVNQCQIKKMEKAGDTLDPRDGSTCAVFSGHVRNVEAAIMHSYQVASYTAIHQSDPAEAAKVWKWMNDLCDQTMKVLKHLKETYSHCGTPALYDLVLDYKSASYKRYTENLQDAECQSNPIPEGLFQKTN